MKHKVQQAILAAGNGQTREAQVLLTEVLETDSKDVQAWFLLSHLVDAEARQIACLNRVLALEPDHPQAQHRLAQLQGASSRTEATPAGDAPDLIGQEIGDSIPDWLAEGGVELPVTPLDEADLDVADEVKEVAGIPDWLDSTLDDEWDKVEESVEPAKEPDAPFEQILEDIADLEPIDELMASEADEEEEPELVLEESQQTAPPTSPKKTPASRTSGRQGDVWLTRILIALVIVAALVLIALLLLVLS